MNKWQEQGTFKSSPGTWHFKVEVGQRAVDWERMKLTIDPAQMKSIEFEGEPSRQLESVIVSAITDILTSGKFIASFDANKQDRKDEHIGARRVPIFATPKQWSRDRAYEHLMMVKDQGNTYISKQAVPVGIDLPTTSGENDYWLLTSKRKVVDDA